MGLSILQAIMQRTLLLALVGCFVAQASFAAPPSVLDPDELVLRNGKTIHGLIVEKNSVRVVMQTPSGELEYRRSDILRIRDRETTEGAYTEVPKPGSLPDWRVVVNDLRLEDYVRTFEQIPATTIDTGVFKNVPYRSFRMNEFYELNVYGDPSDPAGIEIGIYGFSRNSAEAQKRCRDFLASYLTDVGQLNAVYSLSAKGQILKAGPMTLETTAPNAPDAYGAWWISVYNEERLKEVRLSDSEYDKLTLPPKAVNLPDGRVEANAWDHEELKDARRLNKEGDRVLVRGFKRDANGRFQLALWD